MRIIKDADLTALTTFRLPARCRCLIEYDGAEDLRSLYANGSLGDYFHIGGGSNLLFVNPNYDGTVLRSLNVGIEVLRRADTHVDLEVGAAVVLSNLCDYAAEAGLWGIENLYGIPGTVGGALVQNAGAYGAETADVVLSVKAFDTESGEEVVLRRDECAFAYRGSMFKRSGRLIILSATIRLATLTHGEPNLRYPALTEAVANIGAPLTPALVCQSVGALRDSKLPAVGKVGSAGSFFKNPVVSAADFERLREETGGTIPGHETSDRNVKLSAAWLIDKAGGKSMHVGGATVWPTQPLVIVNRDFNATGADVVGLEEEIRRAVAEKFRVELTPEVIHLY